MVESIYRLTAWACDKRHVLSLSQSCLLHGEPLGNLPKASLFSHLSGRLTVVDSYPEARVRTGSQEQLHGCAIAFTHGHVQRRVVVDPALIGIGVEREQQRQDLQHVRASR